MRTSQNTEILTVNIDRIRGYNSVNLKQGYKMIEIYSPLELGTYE